MVNILIIAHSEIATSYAYCIEHILNKSIENLYVFAVRQGESLENSIKQVKDLVTKISLQHNLLILTDIFGATPANIAKKMLQKGKIELLTGLSLPMLLRAVSYSDQNFATCISKTLNGGHDGIIHIDGNNA